VPETTDRGVDTACGCNFHCCWLRLLAVTRIRSGFVIIARASGLEIRVSRFSRPLQGVGVLALLDAGLDTMQQVESVFEVPQCAVVPGVAVGVCIDRRCIADDVEVTRSVISGMRELSSED